PLQSRHKDCAMTKPVARVGDFHGCPKTTGKVPHVGGPIVSGSPNVFIAGVPVARMGDPAVCAAGGMDVIAQGSPTVFVNGQPLACAGHITAQGGFIVSGAGNVIVGDAPAGGSVTTATSLKVAAAQGTATTTAAAARAATAPAPAKANATSKIGRASCRERGEGAWVPAGARVETDRHRRAAA